MLTFSNIDIFGNGRKNFGPLVKKIFPRAEFLVTGLQLRVKNLLISRDVNLKEYKDVI